MVVRFGYHMLGQKCIGLFQERLWSEARDKFLQVGKGFASFPGVLAVISFLQTSTHNEQRETFHRLNTLRLWYSLAYPPPRANSSS